MASHPPSNSSRWQYPLCTKTCHNLVGLKLRTLEARFTCRQFPSSALRPADTKRPSERSTLFLPMRQRQHIRFGWNTSLSISLPIQPISVCTMAYSQPLPTGGIRNRAGVNPDQHLRSFAAEAYAEWLLRPRLHPCNNRTRQEVVLLLP
jgi:hypothetical protein